jgi:hypothetical protein
VAWQHDTEIRDRHHKVLATPHGSPTRAARPNRNREVEEKRRDRRRGSRNREKGMRGVMLRILITHALLFHKIEYMYLHTSWL